MVNPNNIIFVVPTKITAESKSVVLGFVATTPNHHRFYFNELKVGNERSSHSKSHKVHMLKYFENIMENPINLETVLEMAGAFIVRSGKADIDLSPVALEKDTILKLFYS
jgi:hypothetical protein